MYDRPSSLELLQAATHHWESEVVPLMKSLNFKLYFQSLVAVNVMRIVEREMQLQGRHTRAEWSRLNMLLGGETMPDDETAFRERINARNHDLCQRIRRGEFDGGGAIFEHLKASTIEQLEVANPRFLQVIAQETHVE